jgi:hypothetical protein
MGSVFSGGGWFEVGGEGILILRDTDALSYSSFIALRYPRSVPETVLGVSEFRN